MVHLGRARVSTSSDFDEAGDLINRVHETLKKTKNVDLKTIGSIFKEFPVGNEYAHSLAISALFPYAREIMRSSRTKNPSWFKKNASLDDYAIQSNAFFCSWKSLLESVSLWRSTQDDPDGMVITVERGDSRKSLGRKDAFDGFLTSPPYLTRLDYVHATLPELLLLREFEAVPDIQRLRRSMLGSPLTTKRPEGSLDRLPNDILDLLSRIERHSSKASSSYYYRFFSTYFVDLHASMRNLTKVLKKGGVGCMVVQSSHYKEIKIDLSTAIISLGNELGLRHQSTFEFNSRRSMSSVNTRAHEDARKPKNECAVFLRKE